MKRALLFFLIFLCLHEGIKAQVTIGAGITPKSGAILDLKQNSNDGANSEKGLLLPRVKLSDRSLLDITGGVSGLDANLHVGLLVYNLARKDANEGLTDRDQMLCPGVHAWSGTAWIPLRKYPDRGLMCDGSDTGEFEDCGDILLDSEGNEYPTALFGDAGCWMVRNLVSTTNGGVTLTENANANDASDKLYYAKPNGTASEKEYGYLYTWQAAMGGKVATETLLSADGGTQKSTIQGICPEGWVLPSDFDWNKLEQELASKPSQYSDLTAVSQAWTPNYGTMQDWRPFVSGADINKGWGQSFRSKVIINNKQHTLPSMSKADDANGFSALLVGSLQSGTGQGYGDYSAMWSSNDAFTAIGADDSANYRGLWHGNNGVFRGNASKSSMISVRCKLAE